MDGYPVTPCLPVAPIQAEAAVRQCNPVARVPKSMKSGQQTILSVIAWLAPVLAVPLYLIWALNTAMSDGSGQSITTLNELMLMGCAPLISLLLWLAILVWGKVTVWRILGMVIPVLLSLAELFLLWEMTNFTVMYLL